MPNIFIEYDVVDATTDSLVFKIKSLSKGIVIIIEEYPATAEVK